MIPSQLPSLANHLWQSTLFAAVAGFLTLALRKNRAQTRFWLWLAASVKFLIPFSLLVDVGGHLGRHTAPAISAPSLSYVIELASQPFAAQTPLATITAAPASSPVNWVSAVLYAIWTIGFATLVFFWWLRWRRLRAALRTASPVDLPIGIEVRISPAFAEPGVFGVRRPVLLLPAGITDQLTAPQLKAVLAHELCHIRRRDNLATAVHMLVEAVFWFHPLVWWLGARLLAERERACDEEVLRMGNEPEVYAEGILRICELYLESPLPCVAGVTGSHLTKRIEEIMANRTAVSLNITKKAILVVAGIVSLSSPLVVGMIDAPAVRAQSARSTDAKTPKFEVASIKRSTDRSFTGMDLHPGGRLTANAPLTVLVANAYRVKHFQILRRPAWMNSEIYKVEAKAGGSASATEMLLALQALLQDRFKLQIERQTRELGVYALTAGKNGIRRQVYAVGCSTPDISKPPAAPQPGQPPCGRIMITASLGQFRLQGQGVSVADFIERLSNFVDRPVIDRTGYTGKLDVDLEFTPDQLAFARLGGVVTPGEVPAAAPDENSPLSLSTAVRERLGLKLESAKGPVEVLVIDHVERPSAN
jgi:bla regulator protein blaR1